MTGSGSDREPVAVLPSHMDEEASKHQTQTLTFENSDEPPCVSAVPHPDVTTPLCEDRHKHDMNTNETIMSQTTVTKSAQDYQECGKEDSMAEEFKGGMEVLHFLRDLERRPADDQTPIPDMVTQCTVLELAHQNIDHIPNNIDRCINVKRINLRGNKLSSLPWSLSQLKHVTYLNLSRNQFTELPASVCALPHIGNLDLKHNKLSSLPPDFSKLTTLKSLDLGCNQFTELPASVCALPHIENLDLWKNRLSSLHTDISKLTTLKRLNLGGNQLTELPGSLCTLPHIENLDLHKNKLSGLPADISKMTTLKRLSLKYNQLTELPVSVCALPHIENLDLEFNKLSKLPSDVSYMTALKYLNVSSNNITHLPHQLASLTLRDLCVDDNPIQQPPKSVCEAGQDAILRFLTELKESKAVKSCRIQINILGETESGKTSFARSLRHDTPMLTDKADRTRVVEQSLWEIERGVSFNINDFGGHDVYRVGHRIFISQNSIVLVTFDLSTYDTNSRSHFGRHIGMWIDMVQSHNPGVTIALVGTHRDKTNELTCKAVCESIQEAITHEKICRQKWYERQIRDLKEKIQTSQKNRNQGLISAYKEKIESLENIRGYDESRIHHYIFMVSSKTKAGLSDLKDYLSTQAKKRSVTLPQAWHGAAKIIYAKKENKAESTICRENITQAIRNSVEGFRGTKTFLWMTFRQKPEDEVNGILAYLANRGDFIWYPNSPILRNTIFHRQDVLADLLKAVLNHDKDKFEFLKQIIVSEPMAERIKEDFIMRGILSVQVMEALWEPFGLTARETSAMVELMQRLELCFKANEGKDGYTFHFPWLLEQSRPPIMDTKWPHSVPQDSTQLTLNVYFPYRCPDGLYEKLSVRLHSTLGHFQPMRRDWRDGVFVDMASHCMQMTRSQTDRDWVITIAVRGQHLPDLWRTLLQNHDHLMDILEEDWPGLPRDKCLVCPHCTSLHVEPPTLFPEYDKPINTPKSHWNNMKMQAANSHIPKEERKDPTSHW
ncbi:malignant fibrous histiocytoma-amplified sequence 1-like [Lingula anatina]|uniref:Malignant fibrous histiocytoma-amplified sequence 1-like n=1 Tax=Lingula anatina TaxID=7574 RepID=A0A1S3J4C0_LINAN|nr:malignant fibrous histiocytoma-amplified sequence 1-like [Lingula anatina]|eukprot:XP_013405287.2 malignant fibrous histiocytoma-amplified sequence 1-like [Lingula anatina]